MSTAHALRRDPVALADGILSGERLALSRAITLAENEEPSARQLMGALFRHTGRARIIGVTGAPGTGKSTLVTALAQAYRQRDLSVGILAIDPSSPFTGGALLGDRVRMRVLSGDPGVFIRSMATRGSLGGLAKATNDAVLLLDAGGFERIIVETVGVGQAEVEIASTAHTTLVVEAPGLGDEVQAIKAGILEIADLLVVNKADRPGVDRTVRALEQMLELDGGRPVVQPQVPEANEEAWRVTVLETIAASGGGIERLVQQIEAHYAWLERSTELVARERRRMAHLLESILRAELSRRIAAAMPQQNRRQIVDDLRLRRADPYAAAAELLSNAGA